MAAPFCQVLRNVVAQLFQDGVPVSPLVFACGVGSSGGAKGMVAALQQMDQQGCAQWVSAPAGPCGLAAPLTALLYGHFQIVRELLDAKATLLPEQYAQVMECVSWKAREPDTQVRPQPFTKSQI